MDKRYQIFISSTFEDLKAERQAALRAVLEMDHMPAGMELFPASDDAAWRLICDVIDASDYYVLIIGGRYGSLDEAGLGYTEKEYEYSVAQKKPVVALLHKDPDNLPRGRAETTRKAWAKLQAFRARVEKQHTCAYWVTAEELRAQLIVALTSTVKRHPSKGWVRAGSLASEEASREILELRREAERQRAEIERLTAAAPEGAELLAQGDELVSVEVKLTLTNERLPYRAKGRLRYERVSVDLAWDELFSAFGAILVDVTREGQMKYQIARHIKDKLAPTLEREQPVRARPPLTALQRAA